MQFGFDCIQECGNCRFNEDCDVVSLNRLLKSVACYCDLFSIPARVQTDVNAPGQVIFVQKECFASRTLVVIWVDANNSMLIPFNVTVLILLKEIDVNLGDVKRGPA